MAEKTDNSVNADGIAASATRAAKGAGPAPVHLWNPPFCGDLDMEIRADGTWFYNGTPIGRPAMVRLFSNILKREGDAYFLVTPVEKVGIRVVDAPFVAVDADLGADITLTTHVGDRVVVGPDHPITMRGTADEPRPYVHVRGGLDALIDRKTFYRLADAAQPGPDGRVGVTSGGVFYSLEP
ncbi:DUF1285 domain-containing protein [Paracoccus sp. (in: a-proteobacteria)]|uniref:DUF1285 domain-containing protein n=1 Tax=Paracoccus sp. TaxID=267 RepID=UPI0026E0F10F|nr:DUF1285 domain-containing protein [Paracoccus sp. (in: a-proteobacteria)]MDO5647398.1 DUF1285 domain-containing protein [Paracoccus sp. (in: a-proteobacteria)]